MKSRDADIIAGLSEENPNDIDFRVALARAAFEKSGAPDLMSGAKVLPVHFSDFSVEVRIEELLSGAELLLAQKLRERYGKDFVASAMPILYRHGEDPGRLRTHLSFWCFHKDFFRDHSARGFSREGSYLWDQDRACRLVDAEYPPLSRAVLSAGMPHLDQMVREVVSPPEKNADGLHVPVLDAIRGGSFRDCPVLGEQVDLGDPDLLSEGVVIDLLGRRVRVAFDWKDLANEEGWQETGPGGRRLLHIRDAEGESLTKPREREGTYYSLQMFGIGLSQQEDTARPFCGQLPSCLAVFEAGTDFTWTLMVTVEGGEVIAGWLEGSCT